MRAVSRAQSAAPMMASTPKMLANQPLAKPSASARFACATRSSMVAGWPAMSPIPMPMRMPPLLLRGRGRRKGLGERRDRDGAAGARLVEHVDRERVRQLVVDVDEQHVIVAGRE